MGILARLKKPLLIIGFIGLIIFFGYLLWRFFFQEDIITLPVGQVSTTTPPGGFPSIGPGQGAGEEITGPGGLPTIDGPATSTPIGQPDPQATAPTVIAEGGVVQTLPIVQSSVLNPELSSNGGVRYYNKEDGRFYTVDRNGNIVRLSDKVFYSVENVTWAPSADKAILEYPDGSKITYNFDTEKQVTLPSHWEDFSFATDNEQITAKSIGLDENNRWLIVANSDGSKATAIEPVGDRADYMYPSWSPNNQIVAMYTKGVDFDRQEVFFVGLNGENFKSTVVEGRGIETEWSPTGSNLLYSAYHSRDDYKPRLWIVNSSGDSIGSGRQNLDLSTWASKCTFASNTEVYCAVPENLEAGAGMFPELADRTKDDLYKIDLTTGAKTLIAIPNGAYNISEIIVPGTQDFLYFTDKSSEMIYQIKLR